MWTADRPDTVIAAFADHGTVRAATRAEAAAARDALAHFGVGMESVAEELEAAEVQLFEQSFAQLLDELEVKVGALRVGART